MPANTVSQRPHLMIIGNGMATGRLLDEILERTPNKYRITVIGDEHEGSYNRIMLSSVLAQEVEAQNIIQKSPHWYAKQNITFIPAKVDSIDKSSQTVSFRSAEVDALHYDQLVIATGSRAASIPAKNTHLEHIISFRTLKDVETLDLASQRIQRAVVVGGGLLGLEAAWGLASRGVEVTVVHRSAHLLNKQLDQYAGELLQAAMESRNIHFALSQEVSQFIGDQYVTGAELSSGETLSCELVVIATGIIPNAELAQQAGISTKRAILVNDLMTTSVANISALGECCEHQNSTFGLVEPIWQQCKTLADHLCLDERTPFVQKAIPTRLKVSGIQLFSAGEHITQAHHRELVMNDPKVGVYKKILLDQQHIVGVVLFGDANDGQAYFDLMQKKVDVSHTLSTLLLGKAFFTLDVDPIESELEPQRDRLTA